LTDVVLVPLTRPEWATLQSGGVLGPLGAHVPTADLGRTFDLDDPDELERAALLVASVAALQRSGERFVVAAAATFDLEPGGRLGQATIARLTLGDVTAYFVDAPAAAGAVRAAAVACRDLDLDEAWDEPDVQALLEHDLLWHGPSEPLPL